MSKCPVCDYELEEYHDELKEHPNYINQGKQCKNCRQYYCQDQWMIIRSYVIVGKEEWAWNTREKKEEKEQYQREIGAAIKQLRTKTEASFLD